MSDADRLLRHLINLLSRPGVVEIVDYLHEHGGSATYAQVHAFVHAAALPALRALAADGHIARSDGGTWDTEPAPTLTVALTTDGTRLVGLLGRFEDWGRQHLHRTDRPRER